MRHAWGLEQQSFELILLFLFVLTLFLNKSS